MKKSGVKSIVIASIVGLVLILVPMAVMIILKDNEGIQGAQASNGGVSIRISLEIGQIMAGIPVSDTMEFNTLVHLPAQCLPGDAVTRMKCSIVTIGAASRTDSTVPVRASKACIEDYFLQPFSVFFPVITYK